MINEIEKTSIKKKIIGLTPFRETGGIIGFLLISFIASAQPSYRVVFDMTSKDTSNQQAIIRQLQGIKAANPSAQLEVVIYGEGADLIIKQKSAQESQVIQLIANKQARFTVCGMTLKRKNIDKSQLIEGVEIVDDGIYEIIKRQGEGWGYIKVGN